MALSRYLGSFNISTTAAPTTQTVAGVGFTPKVVIFWWGNRDESVDTVGRLGSNKGFGFMTDAGESMCGCAESEDVINAGRSWAATFNTRCIAYIFSNGTVAGVADFNAMNSDGFVLDIATTFTNDIRVFFLALGGTDLTNYDIGTFSEKGSAGTQDITSVGFQPGAVFIVGSSSSSNAVPTADSVLSLGFAAGSTPVNAVLCGASNRAAATTQTMAYCQTGEILANYDTGVTVTDCRASISAWLSNGFTLNYGESASSTRDYVYLALKGPSFIVGDLLTQTDTITAIAETGFGFAPSAVLFMSAARGESTDDTPTDHDFWSVGGAISTSSRGCSAALDEDNLADTEVSSAIEYDAVYANISTSSAIQGLMDMQSFDTNGFTCIMDDADPAQNYVAYIAIGPTVTATLTGTITSSVTEADIVTGGKTSIITLAGTTWIAAGAGSFDLQRDEIIAGHDSDGSEALGWDLVPKATQSLGPVVRTSDTVVTVTWDAFATYNITANETITVTVPSTATVGGVGPVATPTFVITASGAAEVLQDVIGCGVVPWPR